MKFHPRLYGNYNEIGKICVFAAFVIIGGLMTWRYAASIYWRNNSTKLTNQNLLKNEQPEVKLSNVSCTPRQNVVFLYTHDTGSSVLQHVILRHVNSSGPLAAVPSNTDTANLGSYPDYFRFSDLQPLKPTSGRYYGVLAHPVRWDSGALRAVMPKDTMYVTLLRDPVTHFRSLFETHQLNVFYNATLEQFVRNSSNATWRKARKDGAFGPNQMAFDLGADVKVIENDSSAILQLAGQLDGQFHLVAVWEQLEESLLLLADLLCWTVDDVVSLRLQPQDGAVALETDVVAGLVERNRVDKILYDYFCVRLRDRIKEYGAERMVRERTRLTERKRYWSELCVNGTKEGIVEAERATCADLLRSGNELTKALKEKQTVFFV